LRAATARRSLTWQLLPPSQPRSSSTVSPNSSARSNAFESSCGHGLPSDATAPPAVDDRLLGIEEAAARLGTSKHWLYRDSDRLPFTIRPSETLLGYCAKGIDR